MALLRIAALTSLVAACVDPAPSDQLGEEDQALLSLQSIICEGEGSHRYDPPLTNTPKLTNNENDIVYGIDSPSVGACVAIGAPITSGFRHTESTRILSCNDLLIPGGASTHVFTWNTGATSTVDWAINRIISGGGGILFTITRLGTVRAGFGAGHQAIATTTYVNLDLDACATTGVSEYRRPNTIEILPL